MKVFLPIKVYHIFEARSILSTRRRKQVFQAAVSYNVQPAKIKQLTFSELAQHCCIKCIISGSIVSWWQRIRVQMTIGHFQVSPSLCFKARLSAKPLIISFIFPRKILHVAFKGRVGNGLFVKQGKRNQNFKMYSLVNTRKSQLQQQNQYARINIKYLFTICCKRPKVLTMVFFKLKNSKILKSLTINKEKTNQFKYRKGSLVK